MKNSATSVRQNVAVQTLNPDAGGPDLSGSIDGLQAERAVENMRNRSPDAETNSLLQGVSGGGGGGGGN